MGEECLLDTNILIYYISNSIPPKSIRKLESIFNESFNISIISKIEFLGWKHHTAEYLDECKNLMDFSNVIYINEKIAETAIKLRRTSISKTADAIIGATAEVSRLILITRNESDYAKTGIEIYNPFE